MFERKNVRGRISPEIFSNCIACGKIISLNRNSSYYCSMRCNKKGHITFSAIQKSTRDHMFDPRFQAKQLGLFVRKYHRRKGNYYKFEVVLNV